MQYYIVALFDEETYQVILPIQKNMSKKFRASRNSPIPFIPLACIESQNPDKFIPIVDKVVSPYKNFKIIARNLVYLFEPTKSINLRIDNKGYIKRLSRCLSDDLSLNGFNVKNFDDNFISLANLGYISKDLKRNDIKLNISNIITDEKSLTLKIKSIEIWKLPTVKKSTPIKSYSLKTF